MNSIAKRFIAALAMANCICALVDVKRLVAFKNPTAMVYTHRIWLTGSPPDEVILT